MDLKTNKPPWGTSGLWRTSCSLTLTFILITMMHPAVGSSCPSLTKSTDVMILSGKVRSKTVTCKDGYILDTGVTMKFLKCEYVGNELKWNDTVGKCENFCSVPFYMQDMVASNVVDLQTTYRARSGFVMKDGFYAFTASCNETDFFWLQNELPYDVTFGKTITHEESGHIGCVFGDYIIAENTTNLLDTWLTSENSTNISQMCKDSCKAGWYRIAAIRGSTCVCGHLTTKYLTYDNCFQLCPDVNYTFPKTSPAFCGGEGNYYTVFSTFDGCYTGINMGSYHVFDVTLYSRSVTCKETCRRDSYAYAIQHGSLSCFCVDEIIQEAAVSDDCLTVVYDLGKDIPKESCRKLFKDGLRVHGEYLLFSNGSSWLENCHFLDGTVCDDEWIGFKGSCFDFRNTSLLTFDDARQYCHENDAEIVTYTLQSELEFEFVEFVKRIFPDIDKFKADQWWVGLTTADGGLYTWLDGSLLNYAILAPGQPNTFAGNCTMLNGTLIEATECNGLKRVICKKSNAIRDCVSVTDPEAAHSLYSDDMTLTLCSEICKGQMSVRNVTTAIVIGSDCKCLQDPTNFTQEPKMLCKKPCPGNRFHLCGGDGVYTYLSLTGRASAGSCSELQAMDIYNSTFVIQPLGKDLTTVFCGLPNCPSTWLDVFGTCYKFYTMPWYPQDAVDLCASYDAYRITFETDFELNLIEEMIYTTALYRTSRTWYTGLTAMSPYEGVYTWENGKPTFSDFFNFTNNPKGNSRVAVITAENNITIGFSNSLAVPICEKGSDYIGCFIMENTTLSVTARHDYPMMTIQMCVELCRAANTSLALVSGNDCDCADDHEPMVPAVGTCNTRCPGKHFQQCGGGMGRVSVYNVSEFPLYPSCESLFDASIFLSGYYQLNDSYKYCNMKDGTPCYSEWFGYQGNCYRLFTESLPEDYFHTCADNNATMTSITTLEEFLELAQHLRRIERHDSTAHFITSSGVTRGGYEFDVMMNPDGFIARDDLRGHDFVDLTRTYGTAVSSLPVSFFRDPKPGEGFKYGGVICKKSIGFIGCFMRPEEAFIVLEGYSSMELTLCRQLCLVNESEITLLGNDFCACSNYNYIETLQTNSSNACWNYTSIQGYQYNGDGSVVLAHYTGDPMDQAADSCQELYRSGVFYNTTYLIRHSGNITQEKCGFSDTSLCPPNYIGKQDTCFKFVAKQQAPVKQPHHECFNQDAYFASSTDLEVDDFIRTFQVQTGLFDQKKWLVGVYCFSKGYCVKADGSLVHPAIVSSYCTKTCNKYSYYVYNAEPHWDRRSLTIYDYVCFKDPDYLGCFTLPSDVAGTGYTWDSSIITHSLTNCQQWCLWQNYTYAAVSHETCHCLNNVTSLTPEQGRCHNQCSLVPTQSCGGTGRRFTVTRISTRSAIVLPTCQDLFLSGVAMSGIYRTKYNDNTPAIDRRCFLLPDPFNYITVTSGNITASSSQSSNPVENFLLTFPLEQVWKPYDANSYNGEFVTIQLGMDHIITSLLITGIHTHNVQRVTAYRLSYIDPITNSSLFYNYRGSTIIQTGLCSGINNPLCFHNLWHPIVTNKVVLQPEQWEGAIAMQGLLYGHVFSAYNHDESYIGCCPDFAEHFQKLSTNSSASLSDCLNECKDNEYPFGSIDILGTCRCGSGCLFDGLVDETFCPLQNNSGDHLGNDSYLALYRTYEKRCSEEPANITCGYVRDINYRYIQDMYAYGTRIDYACSEGCTSVDPTLKIGSIYCMQNNQWSPLNFQCTAVFCPVFPAPAHGVINTTSASLEYGSTLTVTCHPGYWVEGGASEITVTCGQGATWSLYPTCKEKNLRKMQTIFNARKHGGYKRLTEAIQSASVRSKMDCATRCNDDFFCDGYNYMGPFDGQATCRLFHGIASDEELSSSSDWVYWERDRALAPGN